MSLKVTYVVSANSSTAIFGTTDKLIQLMNMNNMFSLSPRKLTFSSSSGEVVTDLELSVVETENQAEKIFTVSIKIPKDTGHQLVEELLREVQGMLLRIDPGTARIVVTKNEVLASYGIQAYPIILKVENDLRDFISRFMLTKVGGDWFDKNVPIDVANKKRETKGAASGSYTEIYGLDFIDVVKVLISPYPTLSLEQAQTILRRGKQNSDQQIIQLEGLVPRSNYERYFRRSVEIQTSKFDQMWSRLYYLRNQVAHSRGLSFVDLRGLKGLAKEVTTIIAQLESQVSKIQMSKEEKEQTARIVLKEEWVPDLEEFLLNASSNEIQKMINEGEHMADLNHKRQLDMLPDFDNLDAPEILAQEYGGNVPEFTAEDADFSEQAAENFQRSAIEFYEAIGRPYRVSDSEVSSLPSVFDLENPEAP